MKIRDLLIPEQSLVDLLESLSYTPQDLVWDRDTGLFSVGGQRFASTVRPASAREEQTFASFFNPIPKVGNVDFSMITDSVMTQDTTGLMQGSAFKVFGGVAHVTTELTKKHGYQILLCIAKRKHSPTNYESRVSAYEVITDRLARNSGMMHDKLYTTPNETVFVIFNVHLLDGIRRVQQHLANQPT